MSQEHDGQYFSSPFDSPKQEEKCQNPLMFLAQQAPSQCTTESEKSPIRRCPSTTTTTTRGHKPDNSNGNKKKKIARNSRSAPRRRKTQDSDDESMEIRRN